MKIVYAFLGAVTAVGMGAVPALATLPMPPASAAPHDAQAFLFHGGAGDIFEITTSAMAMQHSQNPQVRAFAQKLIADHTSMTNSNLAVTKAAGVMAPPPELSPTQKDMITQLLAAAPAGFDHAYLSQQVTAHQMALQLLQGYAAGGDLPPLRQAAAGALPIVQGHLAQAQQLLASQR